jgi:hypothetical protein
MPASNTGGPAKKVAAKKAATASALGRGAAIEPTARQQKRAAAKKATPAPKQAPESTGAVRGAPQAPSAYSASTWATTAQFEITCPSGQKCLAHQLTIERLMEMGLLEAINSLSGIVEQEMIPRTGAPNVDMTKLLSDAPKLLQVMSLVNEVVVEAVDAPEVHPVPPSGEARVPGLVYIDSIGMVDRFAIFSEVTGGLGDLAAFRPGSE